MNKIYLSPNQLATIQMGKEGCKEFIKDAKRHELIDPLTGGRIVCYRKNDGRILITEITVPR